MIRGLHYIAVAVADFGAAVDGYRRLLGREPVLEPRDGADRAWFHLGNMALELVAPSGEGYAGERTRARLDTAGEGMWIAGFHVDDVDAAGRLLARRGLETEPVGPVTRVRAGGLEFVLSPGRGDAALSPPLAGEAASVAALDHFVIQTSNPERAVANLAGRMGLDLRLDRGNPRFGVRQLWFKCGDAVAEVASRLDAPATDAPDRFGGLAWRVSDPHAAQARLAAAGFDVSEVRPGRKPGTHVFTVRDAPGGVPTLMLQPSPALETT
ncbi:MAG TPA: VOC family protein [Phenylobacterium sp.]|nr:VOC family protein [Phenylobacterium sp.]